MLKYCLDLLSKSFVTVLLFHLNNKLINAVFIMLLHSTDCGTEGSCDRSDDSTARVRVHYLLVGFLSSYL